MTTACGGLAGGVSMTTACGGLAGGVSVNAKAEPATAQPATKAIRLTFIMIAPNVLLMGAATQVAAGRLPT